MNRQSLFLLFLLLVFSGCNPIGEYVEDHLSIEREVYMKEELTKSFFYSEDIVPIEATGDSYLQVLEWYDEKQVMFLLEDNGSSILKLHDIVTGEQTNFFQSHDTILGVKANENRSLYAVFIGRDNSEGAPLLILDDNGNVHLEVSEISDEFVVYWNPYDSDQMLIVEFLPDWDFELYHLSISGNQLSKLHIGQTYLQWIDKKTIAFVNWSWLEPSFSAPLVFYDLKEEEKWKFLDEIIAFFTFSNDIFVTLSVETIYDLNTVYTFYKKQEEISQIEVPILDTFSEQWWIPFHDYNKKKDLFYYLRPLYSGTFIDYKDPFELVAFQIENDKESMIMELDLHAPIKASPNGKRLLYGHQFEEVIDIGKRRVYSLIEY